MSSNTRLLLFFAVLLYSVGYALADGCPPDLVYSPFTAWFHFPGTRQSCWGLAICTFTEADEARKQQYGATALVMGLVPLTLKDIAWPERRIVLVSSPLPLLAAVVVRALGLEPTVAKEVESEQRQQWMGWMKGSALTNIWLKSRGMTVVLVALSFLFLIGSFGALAVVEIYSKGSALGCPYPVFALTWCIAALAPAAVHCLFAKWRQDEASSGRVTAIQGADEAWPVQLVWAIYYIAGTLIFTSIMAVTVIELFVWVVVMLAVTAASKLFALYICLLLRSPVSERIA